MGKIIDEIKRVLSSPWQVVLFLVMPPLLTLYFGLVFGQGIIEHTRTVIVDQDQSSVSQSISSAFRNNRGFNVAAELDDIDEAKDMVAGEAADLVVAVPAEFSRDLKNGAGPSVLLMVNAANMAISANAMKRASEIILTFNAGAEIQRLQGRGFLSDQAANLARPLRLQYRFLGNPSGSFYDFLFWGLLGAVAHFPIMLFAVASVDKRIKTGPRDLLAKLAAFSLLGSMEMLGCITLAIILFPVAFHAGLMPLIFLVLVFVTAIAAMAMFIAMIAPNRVIASQAGMIVVLPALLLSGYTWPMSGFPAFVKILGWLEPLTYFADPLRALMLTGKTGYLYWHSITVLLVFGAVYSGMAVCLCKGQREVSGCPAENLLT